MANDNVGCPNGKIKRWISVTSIIMNPIPIPAIEMYAEMGITFLFHQVNPPINARTNEIEVINSIGNPMKLVEKQIPFEVRLVCIIDAFDAMMVKRPYLKRNMTIEEVFQELQQYCNTQFDEDLVDKFLLFAKSSLKKAGER
jgi:hypothetical protein